MPGVSSKLPSSSRRHCRHTIVIALAEPTDASSGRHEQAQAKRLKTLPTLRFVRIARNATPRATIECTAAQGTARQGQSPLFPCHAAPPGNSRTRPRLSSQERARGTYAAFALCELCARPRPCVSSSSSNRFLVITVSSWTRFDKTSISLRLGTLKTCSARPTRSSNTFSTLFQVSVCLLLSHFRQPPVGPLLDFLPLSDERLEHFGAFLLGFGERSEAGEPSMLV